MNTTYALFEKDIRHITFKYDTTLTSNLNVYGLSMLSNLTVLQTANITTGNITTANVTTANITTGNITTGNITTLIGLQTTLSNIVNDNFTGNIGTLSNITINKTINTSNLDASTITTNVLNANSGTVNGNYAVLGNLAVGKINANERLDINGNARLSGEGSRFMELGVADYGLKIIRENGSNANSSIIHRGMSNMNIVCFEGAPMGFYTTNLERVRINSNGNVGIGTTAPTELFHVNGVIRCSDVKVNSLNIPNTVKMGFQKGIYEKADYYTAGTHIVSLVPQYKPIDPLKPKRLSEGIYTVHIFIYIERGSAGTFLYDKEGMYKLSVNAPQGGSSYQYNISSLDTPKLITLRNDGSASTITVPAEEAIIQTISNQAFGAWDFQIHINSSRNFTLYVSITKVAGLPLIEEF